MSCRVRISKSLYPKSKRFSSSYTSPIVNNGNLLIDFGNSNFGSINLTVSSAWQDFYFIENIPSNLTYAYSSDQSQLNIQIPSSTGSFIRKENLDLKIVIPEYSNISIKGPRLNLQLLKKINGNVSIDCQQDSVIFIDKARGENIHIVAIDGKINVAKSLEGNIHVETNKFDAKMINSEKFKLIAKEVNIGALYSPDSNIIAESTVRVGTVKGNCKVSTFDD